MKDLPSAIYTHKQDIKIHLIHTTIDTLNGKCEDYANKIIAYNKEIEESIKPVDTFGIQNIGHGQINDMKRRLSTTLEEAQERV